MEDFVSHLKHQNLRMIRVLLWELLLYIIVIYIIFIKTLKVIIQDNLMTDL